ncbi:MAG: selenium cofactor biosynthesis protein YqeC, partial [Desulfarculaceae bacterium]|jgi:probable selenium-dependent hydroxylase accessory protein YqeC
VVAIVGSGGKTTLLEALGKELAAAGEPVMITTTTHIFPPKADRQLEPWLIGSREPSPEEISVRLRKGVPLLAVSRYTAEGKLSGLDFKQIQAALHSIQGLWVVAEADGAARRPLKAWADWEPAVPPQAGCLVVMAGASGLGRPLLKEWVHRPEIFARISGLSLGQRLTPALLAKVLTSEGGPLKALPAGAQAVLVINQADAASASQLRELARALDTENQGLPPNRRYVHVLAGSLRQGRLRKLTTSDIGLYSG